ncbi:hypothetical protein [Limnothrix redekei]|uniref:Uncharacterized protein n=1 Tax=Limnothrix redekei LRLZ20PSL1 TaxID=3112953 RepID=A0ABW7CGZ1_9CYAN
MDDRIRIFLVRVGFFFALERTTKASVGSLENSHLENNALKVPNSRKITQKASIFPEILESHLRFTHK